MFKNYLDQLLPPILSDGSYSPTIYTNEFTSMHIQF